MAIEKVQVVGAGEMGSGIVQAGLTAHAGRLGRKSGREFYE